MFAGVILIWLFNTLANVIRGTGNTLVPGGGDACRRGAARPAVRRPDFRLRPVPALGVAGGATGLLAYYGLGSLAFVYYLWSGRAVVTPKLLETRLRWPLFRDILRIGLLASLTSIMTNVTIALTTGVVGAFGPAAIAGYGVGTRLEYHAHPARLRLRRAAGRAGRHQHGRGQPRARAARGLDRRLALLWLDRGDRRRGGAVSGRRGSGCSTAIRR